jgi:branched-subunit amino acid ABC-type transport system permease component
VSQFYPFLIVGLVAGSIYGMTAVGLVLTYRTSGIFNFGHGAIAAANAFLFYELREQWGLPWPLAGLACLVVLAPMMGFVLERMAKALAAATTAAKVVATVGLLVAVQGLLLATFGPDTRQFKAIFPTHVLSLGSVNVGVDQLLTLGIAVAITTALAGFLARNRLGVAMRGVVDDPDLINLSGTNPARVRRAAWAIGSSVAALSGILIAPTIGLDAVLLTYLVIQAFGAAAIGRFSSMPRTFAGGLVVGVGASLATKYVGQIHWLTGFPPSFPFIVLFAVLLFTRRGRFVELGASPARVTRRQRAPLPVPVRRAMGLALAAVVLAVPSFAGVHLSSYADAVVFVLMFASLRLLVVTSGQVSLCHAAFAAVGATTFSHLTTGAHWPWLVALLAAGLVAVPVGAVLALPAIRLSGLYLALATFGFGVLLQRLVYPTALMFGSQASLGATRPALGGLHLGGDKAFYFVCVAVVAVGVGLVHLLTRTRLGRLLRALSDSPTALTTLGAEVNLIRTLVFCISAALAAIAGALYASFIGSFGSSSFDALLSLTLLVVLAIAGSGEISAPVVAAAAYIVVPSYIQSATLNEWLPVLFGVSAIAVAVTSARPGPAPVFRLPERVAARRRESPVRYRLEGSASAP